MIFPFFFVLCVFVLYYMQVKAILVNIFGGIVDCTTIANGIVAACREIQMRMPLVVRLEGKYNNSAGAVLIHLLLCSRY
jgi:succinyl-CoA synthetase beta subunit